MTAHVFSGTGLSDAELKKAVGQRYQCGLSDGTRWYGYMFEPTAGKDGGFHWKTDTTTKEALTQFSSQQLIDRDLAFFPRVTDGDFSGGGYQEVFLDPRKYFDSDLEPNIPGFLELRSSWTRVTKNVTPTIGEVVAWKGDFWFTGGEANGNVYSANGGTTTVPFAAAVVNLDTDGQFLYAGFGDRLRRSSDGVTWVTVSATLNGTAARWWVVNQGTNGYFAYYLVGANTLYKIDLTLAFPVAAGSQPQVPTGGNQFQIVDIAPYQTAIAISTNDQQGSGCDVWFHDGTNMTRIVRVDGYLGQGMCAALGNLYLGAYAVGQLNSPELIQIASGGLTVVAKPGSPFPLAGQSCFQPRASSNNVYWPLVAPSIKGISSANVVILQYNLQTGAVSHLPNLDTLDGFLVNAAGFRGMAVLGDNVAGVFSTTGTNLVCQYQTWAFGTLTYSQSGWLASSHIDFGTPGIVKRFRRLEVHHAPLNAGEQIFVECFVDQDPLAFSTALAPVPAGQTGGTNAQVGSTLTSLLVNQDTVGKTLYFAIKLTAGTGGLTTPRVSYVTIEVGGTWVADLNLACTQRRKLLTQEDDSQGATGADLIYLIELAYENGNLLTFYHPNGQTYTMAIETSDRWNPSVTSRMASQENRPLDEEGIVHTVLRQVA